MGVRVALAPPRERVGLTREAGDVQVDGQSGVGGPSANVLEQALRAPVGLDELAAPGVHVRSE